MPEQYKKGNMVLAQISGGTFTDICAIKNQQLMLPNNNQDSTEVEIVTKNETIEVLKSIKEQYVDCVRIANSPKQFRR